MSAVFSAQQRAGRGTRSANFGLLGQVWRWSGAGGRGGPEHPDSGFEKVPARRPLDTPEPGDSTT
jgi:hypothetical protein